MRKNYTRGLIQNSVIDYYVWEYNTIILSQFIELGIMLCHIPMCVISVRTALQMSGSLKCETGAV